MRVLQGENEIFTRFYLGRQYEQDVQTNIERLYLGGDAYSAPAVLIREGVGGLWNIHYLCRDYLGSITHITNGSGNVRQELSYDAWGRLRNPNSQTLFAPGNEPNLLLGRGFTGHEHLPWFGLINCNARLYDPAVGRFLSPDPYVVNPLFSQDYNRYTYCRNNPLKYTDPSGKIILTSILIGAGVALLVNYTIQVASNMAAGYSGRDAFWGNINLVNLAVSTVLGGLTGGTSAGLTASTAIGRALISDWGSAIIGAAITSSIEYRPGRDRGWTVRNPIEAAPYFIFSLAFAKSAQVSGKAGGNFSAPLLDCVSNFSWQKVGRFGMELGQAGLWGWLPEVIEPGIIPIFQQNNPGIQNPGIPNIPTPSNLRQKQYFNNNILLQNESIPSQDTSVLIDILRLR